MCLQLYVIFQLIEQEYMIMEDVRKQTRFFDQCGAHLSEPEQACIKNYQNSPLYMQCITVFIANTATSYVILSNLFIFNNTYLR